MRNLKIKVLTKNMHPSHIAKGYFILKVGSYHYPFCGGLMLENTGFLSYENCVKSFNGRL